MDIIVTTPTELRSIIDEALREALPRYVAQQTPQTAAPQDKEELSITEAVDYLASQGVSLKRATLYSFACRKEMPYAKVGNRIVFRRSELRRWLDKRTVHHRDVAAQAATYIACHRTAPSSQ